MRNQKKLIKYHSIAVEEKILNYVEKAFHILDECNIKYSDRIVSITINNRLRSSWGLCRKKNINNEKVFVIELNQYLLEGSDNAVMNTLLHELLHTCYNSFNHGKTWLRYAVKINAKYGYNIKRTENCEANEVEPQKLFKYFVKCKKCGNLIGKTRLCKVITNPEQYRCAKCKGSLMVVGKTDTKIDIKNYHKRRLE